MARIKDITGQKFGKLTAIEPTERRSNGNVVWKCKCDCGNEYFVPAGELQKGNTRSCGCLHKANLTEQKFGKLTALEPTDKKMGNSIIWKCKCDCGNFSEAAVNILRSGKTKSCGCLNNEYEDLTNMRFGRLTALEPTEKRSAGSVVWKCKCDCGKFSEVSSHNLKSGKARSCGCVRDEKTEEYRKNVYIENTDLDLLSSKPTKANTSGRRGVSWYAPTKSWRASIGFKNKTIYLGTFKNFEDAVRERELAEEKYYEPILEENGRKLKKE